MVEGTFIDLREATPGSKSRQRLVVMRDPSVRDYLWGRLEAVDGEADALLENAIFFEQCVILYEGGNHANSMSSMFPPSTRMRVRERDVIDNEAVAARAVTLLSSDSPMVRRRWWSEDSQYYEREQVSFERRTAFLMAVLAAHQASRTVFKSASFAVATTIQVWEKGQAPPSDALELFNQIKAVGGLLQENFSERAERALLNLTTGRLEDTQGFKVLVDLATLCPNLFAEPLRTLESWNSEFEDILDSERDWLLDEADDPDWLKEEMRSISRIASAMGMDISDLEADVECRIEEMRSEREPENDNDLPDGYSELSEDPDDESEIDALFQSLR